MRCGRKIDKPKKPVDFQKLHAGDILVSGPDGGDVCHYFFVTKVDLNSGMAIGQWLCCEFVRGSLDLENLEDDFSIFQGGK